MIFCNIFFYYFSHNIGFDISIRMQYQSLFRRHTEILFFIILLTTQALIFQFDEISEPILKTFWNIFSYFSQKTGFDISCKLSPIKNDNLHEISKTALKTF